MAWLLKAVWVDKSFQWQKSSLYVPLLLYGSTAVLATVFSIDPLKSLYGNTLREEGLITILSYLGITLFVINHVRNRHLAKRLLVGLTLSTSLLSAYGIVQYLGYNPTEHFFILMPKTRAGSTLGNPNFLGKYLVLTLPCIVGCLTLAFCSCLVVWFVCLIPLFLRFQPFKRRDLLTVGVIFGAIILFFNVYTPHSPEKGGVSRTGPVSERIASAVDTKKGIGVATRLFVWKKTLKLIAGRPILGYGPETFQETFRPYNVEYVKLFGDYVIIDRAHNNYLDIAHATGLLGLACYLSTLGVFFTGTVRFILNGPQHAPKWLLIGILSGWCGCLVNDLFIFSTVSVSPTFWAFMGLGAAITLTDPGEPSERMLS
jgi:putative inorganic carbon (HCO3(-)) transporter